ncbi:zinc finger BED domain-containing protein 4-like [Lampris incognitus]|uniref:zinc finger BED domain-containing protein 4-like n=1 Tax=Lampris incognitus TaxID=2546036 RepID=UPI0024B5613B|nr:zinc finger BED domain-containing protein 4-like [Lampris incognitus]
MGFTTKDDRFLEQEKAIARVLGSDKKSRHLVPSWQDIDVLESINKAVKPLQDFTDALSGEAYVSVSYIKPVLHLFKTSLLQPEEEATELTETIKTNILRYLDEKYSNPVTDELLDMSSLMDPRSRTTYIDPGKVEQVKKRAVTELMSLPVPAEKSTPQQPGLAVQVCQEAQPPPNKKMTLASFFKKNVPLPSPHQSGAGKIETELATYLLTPEADPDTDPLQWWKHHEPNFPRLSNLAKKYLSIPATSAPSERVFSVGGWHCYMQQAMPQARGSRQACIPCQKFVKKKKTKTKDSIASTSRPVHLLKFNVDYAMHADV